MHVKAAEMILVEDMTVCVVSNDEESDEKMTERLLAEKISSTECNFVASRDEELEKHCEELHGMETSCTLNQEAENVPPVKPLPLYKCSECSYATTTNQALKQPKRTEHEKEKSMRMDAVFLYSCISCECKFFKNLQIF